MSAGRQDERRECASNNSNTEKTLEPAHTNVSDDKDFVCAAKRAGEESVLLKFFHWRLCGMDHATET